MCGIVGYVGYRSAIPVLVQGLEHLEYRGYDSAGIACLDQHQANLFIVKEKGKLSRLKEELKDVNMLSQIGIGHTRWATHGEPSRTNAHPHTDYSNRLALVHNGIIENYASLKTEMQKRGITFRSKTDTEIAANLIGSYYKSGKLLDAFKKAIPHLKGFFAFVVMAKEEPDKLIVFKRSNPIVLGIGKNENFVASDVSALLPYTKKVLFLEDEEYALVTRKQIEIYSIKNHKRIVRKPTKIRWNMTQARKGGYPHFMLKEIDEQPRVLEETLTKRLSAGGGIAFDTLSPAFSNKLRRVQRVHLVSCGTAYHAGLVGNYMLGKYARIVSEATVSSEFRYEDPIVGKKDLVILITQSGETADTLAALREAKAKGALTLAVVNVVGSTIAREADAVIYTHAGPEIGVASTKAYTAQLITLLLFSFYFGMLRKVIEKNTYRNLISNLRKLPKQAQTVLDQIKLIEKFARKFYRCQNFLYLGRGYNFPNALEGALKLKEISYAHAHGYAAGEMKHGPIALVDKNQPLICIAPHSKTYEKMISNIEEIKARKGIVITIGTEGDKVLPKLSDYFFPLPETDEVFSCILAAIPLQLFAYKVSVLKGRDVDQPRNLAKSVTVE